MAPDSTCRNFSNSGILITLHGSLRKQRTLCDTTTGFPTKWRLRNERRNSILMTRHYPDLDSSSDWLNQISHAAWPLSSSIQIWVVKRHQYGLSSTGTKWRITRHHNIHNTCWTLSLQEINVWCNLSPWDLSACYPASSAWMWRSA